jgi:hypothetical protein
MAITSIDELDNMSDDQLWEVAANTRINAEIRHEAIQRWLYPEVLDSDADPDDFGGSKMLELAERATIIEDDELEEDDIEDLYRAAPYFDGQGRLLLEYNGVQYLIDSEDEELLDDSATV